MLGKTLQIAENNKEHTRVYPTSPNNVISLVKKAKVIKILTDKKKSKDKSTMNEDIHIEVLVDENTQEISKKKKKIRRTNIEIL